MSEGLDFDGCDVVRCLRSGPVTNWYLATQSAIGRAVVIKSLSPNVLPQSPFAAPLVREAQLLGRLQHKGIVTLYDLVRRDQRMWLVREYVDGQTLAEALEKHGPLEPLAALAILEQLTETLAYVHSQGIVHRDLQPKNILVSRAGDVKLSNFFLATERLSPAPPELLESDSGFAAPYYMSPEQVLGEAPDPRSDLFSLGVVLYEMLTGRRPFDAPDRRSTTQRIRHEPPAPIDRGSHLPFGIERLLQRALQKLQSDRFADAREMNAAVSQCLSELAPHADNKALVVGGIAPRAPSPAKEEPRQRELPSPRWSPLARALFVYVTACFALLAGVALIRQLLSTADQIQAVQSARLELNPTRAGYLHVLARPWATVFVDGEEVRTTPFADKLPLRPGVHYVRLEHPDADPERRRIEVSQGQSVTLDVEMALRTPLPTAPVTPTATVISDAGPPSP